MKLYTCIPIPSRDGNFDRRTSKCVREGFDSFRRMERHGKREREKVTLRMRAIGARLQRSFLKSLWYIIDLTSWEYQRAGRAARVSDVRRWPRNLCIFSSLSLHSV